jgi:chromosome segregation ATPase
MREPAAVLDLVERTTTKLDTLSKMLADAHDEKSVSEEEWDVVKDATAESLHDEYRDAGRKSDPAEHTIVSVARRANRVAYQRMRRARREVDKLEEMARNRRAELSGFQSELAIAKAELQGASGPQPSWSGGVRGLPQGAKDRAA